MLRKNFIYLEIASLILMALHGIILFGPQILLLFALTYISSTAAELLALKTPIGCFGVKYKYDLKNPRFSSGINFFGVYPLEISLAWMELKYISFCLGVLIVSAFKLPEAAAIALIPLILVSLDFIIDPVSVFEKKLWKWESGSFYFGIPLSNFTGWYLVGLAPTLLYVISAGYPVASGKILYLLPVIFYALVFRNTPVMFKKNRTLALSGTFPAFLWLFLSTLSLMRIS